MDSGEALCLLHSARNRWASRVLWQIEIYVLKKKNRGLGSMMCTIKSPFLDGVAENTVMTKVAAVKGFSVTIIKMLVSRQPYITYNSWGASKFSNKEHTLTSKQHLYLGEKYQITDPKLTAPFKGRCEGNAEHIEANRIHSSNPENKISRIKNNTHAHTHMHAPQLIKDINHLAKSPGRAENKFTCYPGSCCHLLVGADGMQVWIPLPDSRRPGLFHRPVHPNNRLSYCLTLLLCHPNATREPVGRVLVACGCKGIRKPGQPGRMGKVRLW